MKKYSYSFVLFLFVATCWSQNSGIGIGTANPHPRAILEVRSATQGLLVPRMTQAQRASIVSPANGLMLHCTDCSPSGLYVYDGNSYIPVGPNQDVSLTTLNCTEATHVGTLKSGELASGVATTVPYTGGNGTVYNTIAISSTGVTGLQALASYGVLANGAGSMTFLIVGTPSAAGIATFSITIGGQSCSFTRTVN
jgi:hypothetical protein